MMNKDFCKRPWGYWIKTFENKNKWIKYIIIKPYERISLQRHKYREEEWTIVDGEACIEIGGKKFLKGKKFNIRKGILHRAENLSLDNTLTIREVATGKLSEKDIQRFDDDYGRG